MITLLFIIFIAFLIYGIYLNQDDPFARTIIVSVFSHTNNLATVREWDGVYQVYEKQLSRLKELNYEKTTTLFNHDTPVHSIVTAHLDVQQTLARVEAKAAEARVAIEARRAGPFWFVVAIYGEP